MARKFASLILSLALSGAFLSGCVFTPAGILSGGLLLPSVGSETSPPNSTFLYIDLDTDYYDRLGVEPPLYEISTTEEYGDSLERDSVSNCEIEYIAIDDSSRQSKNKICILDIMEQELFLNDLPIVYNVPERMCTNVYVSIPWHYNYEVGQGPSSVTKYTHTTGSGDNVVETEYFCASNSASGVTDAGTGIRNGYRCVEKEESLCKYNHARSSGEGQISCCFGEYDLDGEQKKWSTGNLTECIGGPGRASWSLYDTDGLPAGQSHYVLEDGVRQTIEIRSLQSVHGRHGDGSIPIANYLKALDKTPAELKDVEREDLPAFFQLPASAPRISYRPHLFFTVECLDQAGDSLHKLSIMFREWNTYEEFARFYASGGADEGDPDVPGVGRSRNDRGAEGEDCEYERRNTLANELSAVDFCNDFWDLDDLVATEGDASFPELEYL